MDVRVQRSRQNLWRGFYHLLTADKVLFSQITVNQICEVALVHRSTFYTHFADKYALLEFGLTLLFADYRALMPKDKVLTPFYWAAHFFEHSSAQELVKRQQTDDEFARILQAFSVKMMTDATSHYLASLPPSALPKDLLTDFLVGTVFTLSQWQQNQKTPISAEEMDDYFQHVINRDLFLLPDSFDTDG